MHLTHFRGENLVSRGQFKEGELVLQEASTVWEGVCDV